MADHAKSDITELDPAAILFDAEGTLWFGLEVADATGRADAAVEGDTGEILLGRSDRSSRIAAAEKMSIRGGMRLSAR